VAAARDPDLSGLPMVAGSQAERPGRRGRAVARRSCLRPAPGRALRTPARGWLGVSSPPTCSTGRACAWTYWSVLLAW